MSTVATDTIPGIEWKAGDLRDSVLSNNKDGLRRECLPPFFIARPSRDPSPRLLPPPLFAFNGLVTSSTESHIVDRLTPLASAVPLAPFL